TFIVVSTIQKAITVQSINEQVHICTNVGSILPPRSPKSQPIFPFHFMATPPFFLIHLFPNCFKEPAITVQSINEQPISSFHFLATSLFLLDSPLPKLLQRAGTHN
ncbi:hypothetical protein ACHAW6_014812, partial [Cyclotella cf. meneghiniana]